MSFLIHILSNSNNKHQWTLEHRCVYMQYWHNTTYRDTFDEFFHVWYLLLNKVIHEEHVILLGTKSIP